jgi:integrase
MSPQASRWKQSARTRISRADEPLNFSAQDIPLMKTFDRQCGPPQKIDLEFLGTRPQLASILADAFWIEMASMSHLTRRGRLSHLKAFSTFLDWKTKKGATITKPSDITFELLGSFVKWLIHQRALKQVSAVTVYEAVAQHLRAARRLHPEEFQADFEIPFHGLSRQIGPSDALDPMVFAEIVRAAETRAEIIQAGFAPGDFPKSGRDLIPFMILIAAYTAINAFSLYDLRRNCLEPHPIDNHSVYLTWKKARSSTGTQRQLHLRRTSRTIALINFLLDYTRPLVERATASQREFLFLYEYGYYLNPSIVRVVSMNHWNNHLTSLVSFCEANALPQFSFGQIRPSAASLNHLKNGGNLRKTQVLLGHKDISTTSIYIDKQILKPLYDTSIRAAQEAMLKRITVIPKAATEAISEIPQDVPQKRQRNILNGKFSTGSGRCVDPQNSPQPGQRKGRTCTLFLACLSCRNSLYFLEDLPRVISLANHLRSLKPSMTKKTWETLYSEHLRVLEDEIIGAFSEKEIAAATVLSSEGSEMPVLMNSSLPR